MNNELKKKKKKRISIHCQFEKENVLKILNFVVAWSKHLT